MRRARARFIGLVGLVIGVAVFTAGCPSLRAIVIIKDAGLDRAIRAELGKPFGFLTRADLLELLTLDARNLGIRDISGLENATNLIWLDLDTNQISDITPLTPCVNLMVLNLDSNEIWDLTPLSGLFNLDLLSLFDNQVGDIGPLITNANNGGLGPGDTVVLDQATLNDHALTVDVPALRARGVNVVLAVETGG